MTFEEVERELPNGFHDAFLRAASVDYVARTAELELEVLVGRPDEDGHAEEREAYQRARLTFSGLLLFAADAPNREYLEEHPIIGLHFDAAPVSDPPTPDSVWPGEALPTGAFRRSFYFTDEYNSLIHVAARDVRLTWLSGPRLIYGEGAGESEGS